MKRQISNEYGPIIPLVFFISAIGLVGIITALLLAQYSFIGSMASLLLAISIGIVSWYNSMKFYKVSFDSDYLYLARFGKVQEIALEKVSEVSPGVFPFRLLHSLTYVVTITYLDTTGEKNIRFNSKAAGNHAGSVRGILHLDTLRQYILQKKYGV